MQQQHVAATQLQLKTEIYSGVFEESGIVVIPSGNKCLSWCSLTSHAKPWQARKETYKCHAILTKTVLYYGQW
ncbi:hypothetical protein E2C01_024589 [Portunus trituberculatus]|uniref:Uncharacterized protein n=1 Tax=Portunus trituberculatus TaxID=210409 RepID=A0A5B7EE73_PORTR|nr:hypothetical protein [Portunus trituberculatus]